MLVVALFVVPHTKFPIEMVFWRSAKMVDPDGAVKLTTVRCIHSSTLPVLAGPSDRVHTTLIRLTTCQGHLGTVAVLVKC